MTLKNVFYRYLKDLNFREWAKLNILLNTINFIQISIISLVSICSSRRIVRSQLTRIIEDTANMNEHLQRNVQNLILSQNRFSRSTQNNFNMNQLIAFANTNTILHLHIQTLLSQANSLSRSISNSGTIINHITKILTILQLQIRYINLFFLYSRSNTLSSVRNPRLIERETNDNVVPVSFQEGNSETLISHGDLMNNEEPVSNVVPNLVEIINRDNDSSDNNQSGELNQN